jgi:S1-C subfamily serine protease
VKATCEVHAGTSGGTGGICHYDAEAKKCYVLTCRHVVMQQTSPLYVKLSDGSKKDATFLGYSASSDLSLLEIDSTGVDGYVEVFEDEIYTGQEVYQVGYGVNASRAGTINKRAGKVIKPSGYVGESSYDVSFMLISGDSGSPIFDAKTKKLMGVGWGHDYQHGKITGPKQCRDFLLTCLRKKNRKPPNIGGGIKSEPAAPTKPVEPTKPIPAEPAKPTAEFTQVLSKVDELSQGLSKLTDVTGKLAESVSTIGNKVTSVEDRLAAVEKSRCACPNGAGGPATTPPPSAAQPGCSCKDTTADLAQVKAELAKLKQTFKAGGTLNFRIEPKK